MKICEFWQAVLDQNEQELRKYFHNEAYVNWHCTNEHFTLDEFIAANCQYLGTWEGKVERMEKAGDVLITVTQVYPKDKSGSFHVTSFMRIVDGKIMSVDEYWADDGVAPQWRSDKHIGTTIK